MARQRRPGRRDYLNDFHQSVSGEYIYGGAHYVYQPRTGSLRRVLARLWAACILGVACALAGGLLPGVRMDGLPYVLLPYAAGMVAQISVVWGLARLSAGGARLREYVYKATVLQLPGRAMTAGVCAAVTFVGSVFAALTGRMAGNALQNCIFSVTQLTLCCSALWIRRGTKRMEWTKNGENDGNADLANE